MKNIFHAILVLILCFADAPTMAQSGLCPINLNFELGVVPPWLCYTGTCCPISTPTSTAPVVNRHTITTGSGVDPYGLFPVVAPGGLHSLRLGNNSVGSQAEKVRYYVHVPMTSSFILVYKFAVVLENPIDHTPAQQPRFEVKLFDSTTGAALPCGSVSYVSSSSLPGFALSSTHGTLGDPVYYRPWDSATVNLTHYAGRTIIVDFSTGDCSLGAHFGYAYLDVSCGEFPNYFTPCDTTSALTFSAPPGYASYMWYDSATFSIFYGTGATLTTPNPHVPTTYAVILTPYAGLSGCPDTSYVHVIPSALSLYPSHDTVICSGDAATLHITALDIVSPLTYSWSPATGLSCSTCTVVTVSPTATTTYTVSVSNPYGCNKDTAITVFISANPGIIGGPSSVCVGSTITLTNATTGGTWSSGSSAATITAAGVVTGVSPGTATISYTVVGPCGPSSATLIITVDAPATPTISGPSTVCTGATVTMTGSPGGGAWTASGGVSVTSAGIVSGPSIGSATVTYTYTNGCGIYSTSTALTVMTAPSAVSLSGPSVVCVGSAITLTPSSAGGTWSSSSPVATVSSTGVVTGMSGGPTIITYILTNSCGTAMATNPLTVATLPVAGTITGPSAVCASSTITLSGSVGTGIWSSSGTATVTAISGFSASATGVTAGTATISYTVTNSCGTAYATKVITVDPLPVAGTISGPGIVCQGSTITLSTSGSGGSWTAVPSSVATVSSAGVVYGVGPGTATISYTVTNSCGTVAASTIITVNPLPTVAPITGPSSVCVPLTITLSTTSTGGTWSSSSSGVASVTPTGVVTGVTAGTATISYSVTNSCGTIVATKPVTVNLFPDAGIISGPTQVCTGKTITLTSTVGGGTWSGGAPSASVSPTSGVVTGIAPGTATISYMLVNGCGPAYATYIVTVNLTPDSGSIAGPGGVCQGSTITLTETSPGGVWTSSSSNATISPLGVVTGVTPGTATIHYNIASGPCTAHNSTVVTVEALPYAGIITGAPSLCATTSILMTETVTGGTWSCSSGGSISSTGLLTGLTPGTVTVSYTYTNSCGTDLATMVVSINVMPDSGTISGPDRVCVGSAIPLTESSPGGVWSSSNTTVASITSSGMVTGLTGGTTTISYVLTTPFCTAHTFKIVTVDALAVPGTIIGDAYLCAGTMDTLTSSVGGGTWSFSGTAATLSSTGVVTAITPGSITVTYTVTNICGPKFTTKLITTNSLPDPGTITGPHKVCIGGTISLSDPTPTYGTWSSGNTGVATISSTGEVTSVAAGTATITYVTTASTGCSNYATHIVTVFPIPDPGIISGPPTVCTLAVIQLTATVPGGSWGSSNATIASIDTLGKVSTHTTGSVIITYTTAPNAGGCIGRTTYPLNIVANAPFGVNENINDVRCYGNNDGSITVSGSAGTGPWQYLWNNGASSATINNLAPGYYAVTIKDLSTGCSASKSYDLKQLDSIVIFPEVTNDVCYMGNGKISVSAAGGTSPYQYSWQSGSTGNHLTNLQPGKYTVQVSDAKNCQRQEAIDVLEDECLDIVVHDGVSPNGDGANDYWIIDGIRYYRNNVVQLFDKWGDKVYEQRGYDNHFDGRGTNGSPLPDGTYFYVIHLNAENGSGGKNVLTGSLLIKR